LLFKGHKIQLANKPEMNDLIHSAAANICRCSEL